MFRKLRFFKRSPTDLRIPLALFLLAILLGSSDIILLHAQSDDFSHSLHILGTDTLLVEFEEGHNVATKIVTVQNNGPELNSVRFRILLDKDTEDPIITVVPAGQDSNIGAYEVKRFHLEITVSKEETLKDTLTGILMVEAEGDVVAGTRTLELRKKEVGSALLQPLVDQVVGSTNQRLALIPGLGFLCAVAVIVLIVLCGNNGKFQQEFFTKWAGGVKWTSDSWLTNLTALNSVVGFSTIVGLKALADDSSFDTDAFLLLNAFFASLIIMIPLLYSITLKKKTLKVSKKDVEASPCRFFYFFVGLTLWAVFGELLTVFTLLVRVEERLLAPWGQTIILWVFQALVGVAFVFAIIYAWRKIIETAKGFGEVYSSEAAPIIPESDRESKDVEVWPLL